MLKYSLIALLAFATLSLAQDDNLVQLAQKLGATELLKLATAAGLASTLATKGPFTVFAPTDEAFQRLPKEILNKLSQNKTLLTDVLEYHVLNGTVKSTDLKNEEVAGTLFAGHSVRVNLYTLKKGKVVTIDGSRVIKADQLASNGVIHVVDKVLFPIPEGTVTDLVSKDPMTKTLLKAVQAANLTATLAGDGPFTVFAPTDEAFMKLPPGTLDKLLANKTQLTSVLEYHVVKGTFYAEGLEKDQDVATLQGQKIHIHKQGPMHVEVNKARVMRPNVPVTNGVVHIIDGVLIPPQELHRLVHNN